MSEVMEQTAEQRVVELEEILFKLVTEVENGAYSANPKIGTNYKPMHEWPLLEAAKAMSLGGEKPEELDTSRPAVSSSPEATTKKPMVLILESSYQGLDWWITGTVSVDSISDYAIHEASDSEVCSEYSEDHYSSMATSYPRNSAPWKALMNLQEQWQERRNNVDCEEG